jgi:sec-independent protein translocase protein TatC
VVTAAVAQQPDGRMSLMEHLIELRSRVIKCATAVMIGAVVAWLAYSWIFHLLLHPYHEIATNKSLTGGKLLQTDPLEGLGIRIRIATYGGIALAMPVLMWQLWRFVSPGLYKHERRYAIPFVGAAITLFVSGAAVAYWTLPKALDWLISIGGGGFVTAFTAQKYFQLLMYMMLAFGIGFEFPILLIFLQVANILPNKVLRKYRRHSIVGIMIIVAVATPSADPISMLALAIPLCIFYEVAIIFGRIRLRRKSKSTSSTGTLVTTST